MIIGYLDPQNVLQCPGLGALGVGSMAIIM